MKKLIPIGSRRMCIQDNGLDRQPMVFIHGLPASKELFCPLADLFSNEYRTIAVDLLDYGESEILRKPALKREQAQNLCSLFNELELDHIILVCHGLGVSVAMELMTLCSQSVEQLIIMSPSVYPELNIPRIIRLLRCPFIGEFLAFPGRKLLLRKIFEQGLFHRDNYEIYLQDNIEASFSGWRRGRRLLHNLRRESSIQTFESNPDIGKIVDLPVLILQGLQDPYIPVNHAARLQAEIEGAELVLLEEAGHFLPIDVPVELHDAIIHFLQRLA